MISTFPINRQKISIRFENSRNLPFQYYLTERHAGVKSIISPPYNRLRIESIFFLNMGLTFSRPWWQSPGSKVQRSKVQRLNNSKIMSDVMSKNREERPEPGTLKPLNPEPLNFETPKIRRINIDKINPCFVNYLLDATLLSHNGYLSCLGFQHPGSQVDQSLPKRCLRR